MPPTNKSAPAAKAEAKGPNSKAKTATGKDGKDGKDGKAKKAAEAAAAAAAAAPELTEEQIQQQRAAEEQRILLEKQQAEQLEKERILSKKGAIPTASHADVRTILDLTFGETLGSIRREQGPVVASAPLPANAVPTTTIRAASPPPQASQSPYDADAERIHEGLAKRQTQAQSLEASLKEQYQQVASSFERQDQALESTHGLIAAIDVPIGLKTDATDTDPTVDRTTLIQNSLLDVTEIMAGNADSRLKATLPRLKRAPHNHNKKKSSRAEAREATERLISERKQASLESKRQLNLARSGKPRAVYSERVIMTKQLLHATMQASVVAANKQVLDNLERKQNYLRNPRINTAAAAIAAANTATGYVRADPACVLFTEYAVGSTHSLSLLLYNTDSVGRRLKVLPPATRYFASSAVSYPPGGSSLLAPGMAATVVVTFCPDSLRDFEDHLVVALEGGLSFEVPLQGRRSPPVLSLPSQLDCGACLVGKSKTLSFPCQNTGCSGVFRVVCADSVHANADADAEADADTDTDDRTPFTIEPTEFALATGDSITVRVTFAPTAEGASAVALSLACDNERQLPLSIVGVGVFTHLALTHIAGRAVQPRSASSLDESLVFENVAVQSCATTPFVITNTHAVPVSFRWKLVDAATGLELHSDHKHDQDTSAPFTISPASGVFEANQTIEFTCAFAPCTFDVSRFTAVLLADGSPPDAAALSQYLRLALKGSAAPCTVVAHPPAFFTPELALGVSYQQTIVLSNTSACDTEYQWTGMVPVPSETGYTLTVQPGGGVIGAHGSVESAVSIQCHSLAAVDAALTCCLALGPSVVLPVRVGAVKGPVVSVESKSSGSSHGVAVDFGLLNFGIPNVTQEATLVIHNHSDIPAPFALQETPPAAATASRIGTIRFEPATGVLAARSSSAVTLTFVPSRTGVFSTNIECRVTNGVTQLVQAYAEVHSPKLALCNVSVPLGPIYPSMSRVAVVTVRNYSSLPGQIRWEEHLEPLQQAGYQIVVTPNQTSVPGEAQVDFLLKLSLSSDADVRGLPRAFRALVGCDVEGLDYPLALEVLAEIQSVKLSYHLSKSLTSPACVAQVSEAQSLLCSSRLPSALDQSLPQPQSPATAAVARQQAHDATIASAVKLLDEHYGSSATPTSLPPAIEFGHGCELFKQVSQKLVIRNHSALPMVFELAVDRYSLASSSTAPLLFTASGGIHGHQSASPPSASASTSSFSRTQHHSHSRSHSRSSQGSATRHPPSRSTGTGGGRARGRGEKLATTLLSNAYEQEQRFHSSPGKSMLCTQTTMLQHQKMLQTGQPVGFALSTSKGVIEPYDVLEVEVVCINGLSGQYHDEITGEFTPACGVQMQQACVKFPMHIGVTGSPLKFSKDNVGISFQWTHHGSANSNSNPNSNPTANFNPACQLYPEVFRPTLTWAPCVAETTEMERKIKVENSSPGDIQLRFQVHDPLALVSPPSESHSESEPTAESRPQQQPVVQLRTAVSPVTGEVMCLIQPYQLPPATMDFPFQVLTPTIVVPAHGSAWLPVSFDSRKAPCSPALQKQFFALLKAEIFVPGSALQTAQAQPLRGFSQSSPLPTWREGALPDPHQQIEEFETKLSQTHPALQIARSDSAQSIIQSQSPPLPRPPSPPQLLEPDVRSGAPSWIPAPVELSEPPFLLNLVATTVEPRLYISTAPDATGEHSLLFQVTPDTAVQAHAPAQEEKSPASFANMVKPLPLVNNTAVKINCHVRIESESGSACFRLLSASSSHARHPLSTAQSIAPILCTSTFSGTTSFASSSAASEQMLSLEPRAQVTLEVQYRPPSLSNKQLWPDVPLTTQTAALKITFSNGSVQTVPLHAELIRPALTPSTRALDFSTVKVPGSKHLELLLHNASPAPATWSLLHIAPPPLSLASTMDPTLLRTLSSPEFNDNVLGRCCDDPSVFQFSAVRGTVHSRTLPPGVDVSCAAYSREEPTHVTVLFKPQRNIRYRSVFRLSVQHGVLHQEDIVLTGMGTFQEEFAH